MFTDHDKYIPPPCINRDQQETLFLYLFISVEQKRQLSITGLCSGLKLDLYLPVWHWCTFIVRLGHGWGMKLRCTSHTNYVLVIGSYYFTGIHFTFLCVFFFDQTSYKLQYFMKCIKKDCIWILGETFTKRSTALWRRNIIQFYNLLKKTCSVHQCLGSLNNILTKFSRIFHPLMAFILWLHSF